MRRLKFGAVASIALAALIFAAAPANADDSPTSATPEEIAATVTAATSSTLSETDKPAEAKADGSFASAGGGIDVAIPSSAASSVVATAQTDTGVATVSVGIGAADGANGALAGDGSVVYPSSGSTDATVQPTEDGLRIHTIIADTSAPTEFTHTVTLSSGLHMSLVEDLPVPADAPEGTSNAPAAGAVVILDTENRVVGGFAAPWAKDANGVSVPTHFILRGNDLVQVVDHTSTPVSYPVVADPYLGFDMISSARWVRHSEGWTMEVTPTGWARAFAGAYFAGVAGWNELYDKYRYRGLNTNLQGMRDQYICHQVVVAIRAPRKPTWNLDEWRPNVGWWQTVNSSCNPGGSKWFD